jgi:iron complex outermembrane recepter protein
VAASGPLAHAAPARIRFQINPKPYPEALLELAQQANVTLIGAAACEGVARGLQATTSLEQALDYLLAGAPCTWKMVAPGTIAVTAAVRDAPRPLPPTNLSEVLVTATKRVRDARQLAVAITAVPNRELQAAGATDVSEAAGQLAGVLATNLGPGRNKLLLRGLSDGAYTGRARTTVATYLDDTPVNYNAPDPDLRLVDVERVEVARGPQGALFGAGSMSGVYRIVSNRPDLDSVAAETRVSAATTHGGAASYAADGWLNVPLLDDVAGLRVSAYQEVQGGYLDDVSLQRENVDRTERRGGRAILLVQPGEDWTVTLTAAAQHLRSDDTHYTAPGLGLKRANRVAEPHVNDITLAGATVRRSWGWGELTSSTGFIRHAYGSFYDATAVQRTYTQFATTSVYSERTKTRMLVQDLFLASRGAGDFQWLVGAYGSYTRGRSPTQLLAQNPGAPDVLVYADQRRDRIRELAAYGEASWEFAPGWTLAAGGRLFSTRVETSSDVLSENFPPRSFDRSAAFDGFAPKLSLQWEFAEGDLVYAVLTEGYRAGGLNSGGALPLPAQRERFRSDRLRNYEVGLKLSAFDRRVAVNAAGFYVAWDDIQTDQFRPSGIPYTTNAGDARILGVETEVAFQVAQGLTAQVNGRLSRTRTRNPNLDFAPLLIDGLPGAPAVSGSALISYERPVLGGDWRLRLVGETTYVGKSHLTWDLQGIPKMGGYLRTRLAAELRGQHFGVQAFVTNPEDSFSDTFAFGNPFNPDRRRQITPQRPRTFGLALSAAY